MTEDPRVTRARELLAESKAAQFTADRPHSAAHWCGRLEVAVEDLLACLAENPDREAMDRYRAAMETVGRP